MNPAATLPPIEDILPHRGTMLLLDRVLDFDAEEASAEYIPRGDAWYADSQGNMPAWIGIELMAQTVATHVSLLRRQQGSAPKHGALLGTRRYVADQPAFVSGVPLRIHARRIYCDASGLGAYECSIATGSGIVSNATLKVFEPDNFHSFLQEGHS